MLIRRTSALGAATALAALAVSVALAAPASSSPGWRALRTDRASIHYPPSWFATTRPLTPVTGPRQLFAIASYAFPKHPNPDGCEPAGTLAKMPSTGALILVWYFGANLPTRGFPPRPTRFRLTGLGRHECFGPRPSYVIRFRQSSRFFQVDVAFGRRAGAGTRRTVLRILDSFTTRPT